MLCWFGIGAGVCVATAEDDDLIRWKKHPRNPIIPIPKKGQPGHGMYKVWDPYLWLEGDTYYCLLGGNTLPNGKDTLYLCKSPDMVNWKPVDESTACTQEYRTVDTHIHLDTDFKSGETYTVDVNGTITTFIAQ